MGIAFSVIFIILVPSVLVFTLATLEPIGIVRREIVLMSFVWGALAFVIAWGIEIYELNTGQTDTMELALANAPILEEFLKLSFLIVIYHFTLARYSGDGLVYGFAVGSGFAIMENLDYILMASDGVLSLALGRIVSAGMFHGSLAAIIGAAVCRVIFYRRLFTYPYFVFLFLFAVLAHQWFNIFAVLGELLGDTTFSLVLGAVMVASVIGIMYLIRFREGRKLAHELPETLTDDESLVAHHGGDLIRDLDQQAARFGPEQTRLLNDYLMGEAKIAFLKHRSIKGRGRRHNIQKIRTDLSQLRRQMRDIKQQLSPDASYWLTQERQKFGEG